MKYQKICIIGDGLAGLVTAVTLKNLNIQVDLIYKKSKKEKTSDYRTTAISENNYKFLKSKVDFKSKTLFWARKTAAKSLQVLFALYIKSLSLYFV